MAITLVEGNNELNVRLIPIGAAKFEYVSDIRQQPWVDGSPYGNIQFEVDVRNVGSVADTCHPIATIETSTSAGRMQVDMGTQVILPGQVATFSGRWEWTFGEPDINDWWRAQNIISEAGVITFDFGLSLKLISVDIEPVGDGTYWVTQIIRVPYSDACFIPTITIAGVVASQAKMYPPEFIYKVIEITYAGEYEIKGVWTGMVYPGEADTRRNDPVVLPVGTHNIISQLSFGYVRGPDEIEGWRTGWENIIVGQVTIP